MGKKINCTSTPRGRKSKDQGGKEIKGRATIYTPVIFVKPCFHVRPKHHQNATTATHTVATKLIDSWQCRNKMPQ